MQFNHNLVLYSHSDSCNIIGLMFVYSNHEHLAFTSILYASNTARSREVGNTGKRKLLCLHPGRECACLRRICFFPFFRFKCGREIKKKTSIWGLRVRVPPPVPAITLPYVGPITEDSIKHITLRNKKTRNADRYGVTASPPSSSLASLFCSHSYTNLIDYPLPPFFPSSSLSVFSWSPSSLSPFVFYLPLLSLPSPSLVYLILPSLPPSALLIYVLSPSFISLHVLLYTHLSLSLHSPPL